MFKLLYEYYILFNFRSKSEEIEIKKWGRIDQYDCNDEC